MEDDFIDYHKQDLYFSNKLKAIKQDQELDPINKKIILRYLKESQLGKTIRTGQKRTIGPGRNIQAAGILILMAKTWFRKPLDKVTMKDMERLIMKLDQGKILTQYNRPYASETKSNVKKFIRKFYKWLLTDNSHYPELVEWIDTSKKEAEIQAVPGLKDAVWKIVELIPDIRRKALVWCAFDSGMREGEILNCRIRDLEKNEDGVYYLTCRHSKTKPRTVSLPYSSELLERWMSKHPDRKNPKAQIWQTTRRTFYKTVKLYGMKSHGINITPHMLRHTSATHYAPMLDRTSFCKRFGWSYSSSMPDRYIDFAKVTEKRVVDIVKADKYNELKQELDDQKIRNQQLTDRMSTIEKSLTVLNLQKA